MVQTDRPKFVGTEQSEKNVYFRNLANVRWEDVAEREDASARARDMWTSQNFRAHFHTLQAGRTLSEETRRKIGQAHTERAFPNGSKEKLTAAIAPFVLRGFVNGEIEFYTGIAQETVDTLKNLARREGVLPKPTDEEKSEARKRARRWSLDHPNGELSEKERHAQTFLSRLRDQGDYFTTNLLFWNHVEQTCPDTDPFDKLRLEVFLKGCINGKVMKTYEELSQEIDAEWFLEQAEGERLVLNSTEMGRSFLAEYVAKEFPAVFYTTAVRILQNENDALDIVNELYVKLLKNGASGFPWREPTPKIMKYLRLMAQNRAFDLLRKRKVRVGIQFVPMDPRENENSRVQKIRELGPEDVFPGADVDSSVKLAYSPEEIAETNDRLRRVLSDPTMPREIRRNVFDGVPYNDIAREQGESVNNVKARVHRWRTNTLAAFERERII